MNKSFQGVYVNPQQIAYFLENWFSSKGYKTQVLGSGSSVIVQAKKEGFFRALVGADRAFTVRIMGGQGYLNVDVGMSNWVKAADVTEDVITALVFWPLAAFQGIEEIYNLRIEEDTMKEVERLIMSSQQFPQQFSSQPYQSYPYQPQTYQVPQSPQMTKRCPACGYENPSNARFCMNCGYNLA